MATGSRTVSTFDLELDPARETERIVEWLKETVYRQLRRRGAVLGLSGGVDSSVCAALCARAFGPERVLGLLMPEADSAPDTTSLAAHAADACGIRTVLEEITPLLESAGCYRRRDEAIRRVLPEYGAGWRAKIVLPSVLGQDRYRLFSVVTESPAGERVEARLTADAYREVVAATSFKQRTRKMLEYHHADRLDYAVVGTPNLLEYDQGFFVKNGDGAADVKPIAHLYKSQVYQLAEHLDVPVEIRSRPPTTDTYALPQTQDEFYFALPYREMDLCLYAHSHGLPPAALTRELGLSEDDVGRIFRDIDAKRRVAAPLHEPPLVPDWSPTSA
jgi:NAD+ synthase